VWRANARAGLAPADVKRLKALKLENAKLKRLLAERDLEVDLMRESAPTVATVGRRVLLNCCRYNLESDFVWKESDS
jgi:hypothetical protein